MSGMSAAEKNKAIAALLSEAKDKYDEEKRQIKREAELKRWTQDEEEEGEGEEDKKQEEPLEKVGERGDSKGKVAVQEMKKKKAKRKKRSPEPQPRVIITKQGGNSIGSPESLPVNLPVSTGSIVGEKLL